MAVKLKTRVFESKDLSEVVALWNRTAEGRSLYYPLTERKAHAILFDKPTYEPEGFFVAEDNRGLAGGIVVNGKSDAGDCGRFEAIFTRTGNFKGDVPRLLMEKGLNYLTAKGLKKVVTTYLSQIDSRDIEMLEFLWLNRFIIPSVYDRLIDQNIGNTGTFLGRELENFTVPEEILALEKSLKKEGFRFNSYVSDKKKVSPDVFGDFPFDEQFKNVIRFNSPLEHLFLAFYHDRVIGGALVSLPYAPTDWILYGCDCGLFGPTGAVNTFRGKGIGKVLLFQSINRLRELNCHYALIPTSSTIYPFYEKAGFGVDRVSITMERSLKPIEIRFKKFNK